MRFDDVFYVRAGDYSRAVDFALLRKVDGVVTHMTEAVFTISEVPEHEPIAPLLTTSRGQAQQIMDELWRVGFRPNDGIDSVAHQNAVSKHLDDMRAIAFNRLKVDMP